MPGRLEGKAGDAAPLYERTVARPQRIIIIEFDDFFFTHLSCGRMGQTGVPPGTHPVVLAARRQREFFIIVKKPEPHEQRREHRLSKPEPVKQIGSVMAVKAEKVI